MTETSVRKGWGTIIGFGVVLWLVPFIVGFTMYTPEGTPRYSNDLFESVMMIVIVPLTCWLAYRLFAQSAAIPASGLIVGLIWVAINVALDIPTLVLGLGMGWSEYGIDVLLSYLAIPAITITVAKAARFR